MEFVFFFSFYRKVNGSKIVVIYKALCLDVAQDQMNGAPNENENKIVRKKLICQYLNQSSTKTCTQCFAFTL